MKISSIYVIPFVSLLCLILNSCMDNGSVVESDIIINCDTSSLGNDMPELHHEIRGALLASRINSLEEFKAIVSVEYENEEGIQLKGRPNNYLVRLYQRVEGKPILSELRRDISQKDIIKARDGNIFDKISLLFKSPYAVAQRKNLKDIYMLARWRHDIFGYRDVAFYNFAQLAQNKITDEVKAYVNPKDSSEKGYINTFNHVTAQAIITSCYSEEIADFIADLHERKNMPELITGVFTKDQLEHEFDNPVDNYVDMINNEWGQELGKMLASKYAISYSTHWTPQLLSNYLNDLQSFYSWSFGIEMRPFRPNEIEVIRFAGKINAVLGNKVEEGYQY